MGRKLAGGVALTLLVLAVAYLYFNNQDQVRSTADTIGADFASGDSIRILKQVNVLPPQLQQALQTTNGSTITEQSLPQSFANLATQQKTDPNATGNSSVKGGLAKGYISQNLMLQAGQIQAGTPTYHVGDTVFVTGQLTTNKLPQNMVVTVTCCGMDAYMQTPQVPVDSLGNFQYRIETTPAFPLGLWDVTITWTGNDGQLKNYDWQFNLES